MKPLDKNQKRDYELSDYDPLWSQKFEELRDFLKDVFGDKALAIEHIGSTSIPGMTAKPVIDVLVIIDHIEDFPHEKARMEQKGHEWGENYIAPNTLVFFKTAEGDRKLMNIHVCEKASPKAIQFLNGRDFMRTHPEWVNRYIALKKELHSKYADDYVSYREGKQKFLEEMEKAALEWKNQQKIIKD